MSTEEIDKIAQGRVWTGADALKIGLVDEIGSLYDAVSYAAGTQGDGDLAVSEALDLRFTQLGAHHLADLSRQRLVCVTAENFDVLPVRNHRNFPLFSVYFIYSKFQNYDSCSIFAKTGSSSAMVSGPKIGSQPDTSEAPDTALVILFFQTSRSSRPGAE